jgi:hypothetical protein
LGTDSKSAIAHESFFLYPSDWETLPCKTAGLFEVVYYLKWREQYLKMQEQYLKWRE